MTRFAWLTGGAALLAACAANPPPLSIPADTSLGTAYRLGAGDRLRITVYNEPTLTGEYAVTDAGNIAFPLIGDVPAQGSLVALSAAIRTRLAQGYLKDPRVSAEMVAYRPYYILGEVTKPGQYPFAVGLRLDQAVATAGGYTYRANRRRVFLRRDGQPGERTVDLRGAAVTVLPGDTIRVGERYF